MRVEVVHHQHDPLSLRITCDDPDWPILCWEHTGACCNRAIGYCRDNLFEAECQGKKEQWFKDTSCGAIECEESKKIPTLSEWGLVVLALLLSGAKVYFGRRRAGVSKDEG